MRAVSADTSGANQREFLRAAALVALIAGGISSLVFLLAAGRRLGAPPLLMLVFALWVLWPFLAPLILFARSRLWLSRERRSLYRLMMMLSLASVASYAYAVLLQAKERPTPAFVVVPPVSVLLLGVASALGRTIARGRSRAHHAGHR